MWNTKFYYKIYVIVSQSHQALTALAHRLNAQHYTGLSDSATRAFIEYSRDTPTQKYIELVESAGRRREMIDDFSMGLINPTAIMAAELSALVDEDGINSSNTRRALHAYYVNEIGDNISSDDETVNSIYDLDVGYVSEILTNKPMLYEFWNKKFADIYEKDPEYHGLVSGEPPQKADWLLEPKSIVNEDLRAALDTVQIESVMNMSFQILDDLSEYYSKIKTDERTQYTQSEIYKKCIQAESFLAQICEVAGLDRLCDALNDISIKIRYTFGGEQDILEKAEEYHKSLIDSDAVLSATREMISSQGYEIIQEDQVIRNEKKYGTMSREYLLLDSNEKELRCIMRVKTVGSIAKKMLSGKKITDFIGLTYITDVDDPAAGYSGYDDYPEKTDPTGQMLEVFTELVANMTTSPDIEPNPSIERSHLGPSGAIYLRLFDDQVKKFKNAVEPWLADDMTVDNIDVETKRKPEFHDDFQVAKICISKNGIPIEVQVKTALMRKQERTGRANHRKHKTGIADDGSLIKAIHSRRLALREVGIIETPKGKVRTTEFIRACINHPNTRVIGRGATIMSNLKL